MDKQPFQAKHRSIAERGSTARHAGCRRLLDDLPLLATCVAQAGQLLVGLDYDGTLTPFVADPAQATLAPESRAVVAVLAGRPNTAVAIVSGRRLDDVRNLVGLDGLIYAGNHGLEIQGPGMSFLEPEALETQSAFGWLAAALRRGLTHVAGVIVEDKALTVSVHFRQVAPAHIAEVARHVHAAAAVAPDCFDICLGSQVFEVRPRVDWQKGSAMRWIAAQLARQGRPVALSLFVGDDRTDEDAFDVLGDGITIKVGDPGETCARYHLDSPREVREFLGWLARVSQGTCQVSKNTADDPPTAPL